MNQKCKMNVLRYLLMLSLLSCVGAVCLAQSEAKKAPEEREARSMIGTSIAAHLCKRGQDDNDDKVCICKGLEGYSLSVKGDEKKPQISLLSPDGKRDQIRYWDTSDPRLRGIRSDVLWLIVREPTPTIALIFTLDIEPKGEDAKWGTYSIIARASPGPVCVVGSVSESPRTGGQSVAIAITPDTRPCLGVEDLQKWAKDNSFKQAGQLDR